MTETIADAYDARHPTTIQLCFENRPACKWPPPEEWSFHRNTIERLYLHENRTLNEVRTIMARKYAHRGTPKMYKSRFTSWGIHKYRKSSNEALSPVKQQQQRQAVRRKPNTSVGVRSPTVNRFVQHPDENLLRSRSLSLASSVSLSSSASSGSSTSVVASLLTDHEGLQDYWRTPQIEITSGHDLLSMAGPNGVSPAVQYNEPFLECRSDISCNSSRLASRQTFDHEHTVTPAIPPAMLPPPGLLYSERLFSCITAYFDGSFGRRAWICRDDAFSASIGASGIVNNVPYRFYNYCRTASQLLMQASPKQGHRLLSRACDLVPRMLLTQDVHTLSRLLDSLMYLEGSGLVGIAAALQDHVYRVATRVLPREHAWYQICTLITRPDPELQRELLAQAWQCATNAIRRSSGALSMATVQCQVELINRVYGNKDPASAERVLRRLLEQCESIHGDNDAISLKVLVVVGYNLIDQHAAVEAESTAADVLKRARNAAGAWSYAYQLEAFELSAWAQSCQGKQRLAETNLRKAIDGHAERWGRDDTFLRRVVRLASWLRDWGRFADARKLTGEIVESIGSQEKSM